MGLINKRTLLLGGLAAVAVAGALKNRDRVAGLLGVRTGGAEPPPPEPYTPTPPTPSNYDVAGPPQNTATAVPAPEPAVRGEGGIDEAAEEQAAAAEAAAIGGEAPAYAGSDLGERADEEERPVMEAGGGVSEGQEQAEAALQDNAEPAAGDAIEGGRQIEETIEQADQPAAGERVEPLAIDEPRGDNEQATQSSFFAGGKEGTPEEEAATPEGAGAGLPDQGVSEAAERAAGERPAETKSSAVWAPSEQKGEDEGEGGEWQTWSGRAADQ